MYWETASTHPYFSYYTSVCAQVPGKPCFPDSGLLLRLSLIGSSSYIPWTIVLPKNSYHLFYHLSFYHLSSFPYCHSSSSIITALHTPSTTSFTL